MRVSGVAQRLHTRSRLHRRAVMPNLPPKTSERALKSAAEDTTMATSSPALKLPIVSLSVMEEDMRVERTGTPATSSVTPRRFFTDPEQLTALAAASVPLILRLGSGALTRGWSASFVREDAASTSSDAEKKEAYTMIRANGFMLQETSATTTLPRPAKPIVLYDNEACPFCRKVRECVGILDLDVLYLPTPRGGKRFRKDLEQRAGRVQVPYMIDPNTGSEMFESDAIMSYLCSKYGKDAKQQAGDSPNPVPMGLRMGLLTTISCALALMPRMASSSSYTPSTFSDDECGLQPLWLWGYEASPFTKVVREQLNVLEIPHVFRSCARGSPKRQTVFDKEGSFQVPYLEDPNNDTALFESLDIRKYLQQTYGTASSST